MREPNGSRRTRSGVATGIAAMVVVVTASNILVQYPINDWLTWGALSYPFAFLVTDLTNRRLGPVSARRVVWAGFAFAVVLSAWLATPRIAGASGTAFLIGQLADVWVFDRLRHLKWWQAPLASVAGVSPGYGTVLLTGICRNRAALGHLGNGRSGGEGGVCGIAADPVPTVA